MTGFADNTFLEVCFLSLKYGLCKGKLSRQMVILQLQKEIASEIFKNQMTSKNEKKKYSTEFLETALLENSIKKSIKHF